MSYTQNLGRLADQTPADRNRAIDALRAMSILVVVFGHWLIAAVSIDSDGDLVAGHLLDLETWTHPLTWILQVMPVFFIVGGYANGLSWRSTMRKGEPYAGWLRARLRRLVLPVVPLLLVWSLGGWLALRFGVDSRILRLGSQAALVPVWFLATYVVIVSLAPLFLRAWERFGWVSVAGLVAAAGVVDIVSISVDMPVLAFANYVFVWGAVHQLGFAWLDGKIGGTARRLGVGLLGLAVTFALVRFGPYPVAMVGLDASELTNSAPPRVTLAFLGLLQFGIVTALEGPLKRFLAGRRAWMATIAVSANIMTLYLWHLTAMVVLVGVGLLAGGVGFGIEPTSTAWWLTRPLWFLALAILTFGFVAVFGRFERPQADPRPAPPVWQPIGAVVAVCAGLGALAAGGIADSDGLNGFVLALPFIGLIVGGVGGVRFHRSRSV